MTTPVSGPPDLDSCVLEPHDYWRAPEDEAAKRPREFWVDPDPDDVGMLSARSIQFYQDQIDPMIDPFTQAQLGTATYELRVGPHWLLDEKHRVASLDDPWIEIPPNSLVYVSMYERLRLPLYIAARFDLHIKYIYRGLLLGTGPQVDPGFCGVLSCPLHNITDDTVRLRLGERFAKMEFLKTSPIVSESDRTEFEGLKTFPEVREWARKRPKKDLPLIDPAKLWKEPIFHYVGDRRSKSSVKSLDDRVERVETRIRNYTVGGLIGFVLAVFTFIGLQITVMQVNNGVIDDKVEPLAKQTDVATQSAKLDETSKRLESSEARAKALAAEVKGLQRRVERLER